MVERLGHRVLGDLVEDDPLYRDIVERVAPGELLGDVPGDGLALPVRVGREEQLVGALERRDDLLDALFRPLVDLPDHGEVVLGIDRAVLGRQVAHVAIAGEHPVARAQVFVDGLGLGRRFDDDDVHKR